MDVGRRLHRDDLALARLTGDGARRVGHGGQRRDPLDRTDQVDQVGDVVGAEIEDRAAAGQEEEVRVRMPHLHARAHHVAGARRDAADLALVDIVARKLMGAAEEGVRRAADLQALGRGECAQLPRPASSESTSGFSE